MNFLLRVLFNFRKPKVVVVTGKGFALSGEAIYCVLKKHFRVRKLNGPPRFHQFFQLLKKDIFIITANPRELTFPTNRYLLEKSSLPIIVVTDAGDISSKEDLFAGDRENTAEIEKITKLLPAQGHLVLNFDNDVVREIKNLANAKTLTFGFQEKADIWISDVNSDINEPARNGYAKGVAGGTNFKINYQGKIVPVWLAPTPNEDKSPSAAKIDEVSPRYGIGVGKEQIYASISAVAVGIIFGLNLVEISQALRNYRGLLTSNRKVSYS